MRVIFEIHTKTFQTSISKKLSNSITMLSSLVSNKFGVIF